MDSAADAAATALGAWAWIRGYFTPATLFLVVNLVIGTIALTSRAATHQRRRRDHSRPHDAHHLQHQEPLHHPQPLMEHQPGYDGHYYHPHHHPSEQQQTLLYAAAAQPPLARTSSVLDRLRSFGLYRFRSGDFPPEFSHAAAAAEGPPLPPPSHAFAPVEETTAAHYARSRSEPAPPAAAREGGVERRPPPAAAAAPLPRAKKPSSGSSEVRKSQALARAVPSRTVEAVAAADYQVEPVGGFRRGPSPLQQQEYQYQEEEYVPPARAAAPLQRTSSVLDRLRSFGGLYGFLAPDEPAAAVPASDGDGFGFGTPAAADERRQANAHAHHDRSRSEPALEQGKKKKDKEKQKKPETMKYSARMGMGKSSSAEARKKTTATPRPLEAGGECVNARAEAFIDSFRQQQQQPVVHHYQDEEEYVPPPVPLSRTSSVLNRLRSFGLYGFRSGDLPPGAETDEIKEKKEHEEEAAHYGRSRSEPAGKKKREARMSKSSSSGGGMEVEEAAEAEAECVDARADDFINKFRQQLQLQRLNSLLNYKEMPNRGGGKQ